MKPQPDDATLKCERHDCPTIVLLQGETRATCPRCDKSISVGAKR